MEIGLVITFPDRDPVIHSASAVDIGESGELALITSYADQDVLVVAYANGVWESIRPLTASVEQ